jgi:hypothetical protein
VASTKQSAGFMPINQGNQVPIKTNVNSGNDYSMECKDESIDDMLNEQRI